MSSPRIYGIFIFAAFWPVSILYEAMMILADDTDDDCRVAGAANGAGAANCVA
jgi:hypothetical protein